MLRRLALAGLVALVCRAAPQTTSASSPIELPQGYYAFPYVTGLSHITSISVGDDGSLYILTLGQKLYVARDLDHNEIADEVNLMGTGFYSAMNVTWRENLLYVSTLGEVCCVHDDDGDDVIDVIDTLITGLPYGQHQNAGIAFGPDGLLYLGSGSMSNVSRGDSLAGAILRFQPDGTFVDVYATGFRNPFDLAWVNGNLFVGDNSRSADSTNSCWLAPDEVNKVGAGKDYGFPDCYGVGDCADLGPLCVPTPCGAGDCELVPNTCNGENRPKVLLDPHSAPTGLTGAAGFPGFRVNDVFVALFGQGEAVPGCDTDFGHTVVWFDGAAKGNQPTPAHVFASGFQNPIDVAVSPDGALYVADFAGTVYRIIPTEVGGVADGDRPAPRLPAFALQPNPARSGTAVRWLSAPAPGTVVTVYDLAGRRVAELPATGDVTWDLRDASGRRVAAGVYLVRAADASGAFSRKLLVAP